jgi:hypothetical protein
MTTHLVGDRLLHCPALEVVNIIAGGHAVHTLANLWAMLVALLLEHHVVLHMKCVTKCYNAITCC